MGSILVNGCIPLQGKVRIQGSKNAALPILAACLLVEGDVWLENCPKIADVYRMIRILRSLGCMAVWEGRGLHINTDRMNCGELPAEAVTGMRSSLFLLGALIGRNREVFMEYPGGCVIGKRPIDIHLDALSRMGVVFEEKDGLLHARTSQPEGCEYLLPFPSVGATENMILAAVMARGVTIVRGAAREPEVVSLCEFLNACGADVEGVGTDELRIEGGLPLSGIVFRIPPDRIVAGTYLFATMITAGSVLLEQAPVKHMEEVIRVAESMGAECQETREGLFVQGPGRPVCTERISTQVYPGFPTDLQSMLLVCCCVAEGESRIWETIFENRFRIVEPLQQMGANLWMEGTQTVCVKGVERLAGQTVEARELRGGAALVLAGLTAYGDTRITGTEFIDRGYENICRDLRELGARITSV